MSTLTALSPSAVFKLILTFTALSWTEKEKEKRRDKLVNLLDGQSELIGWSRKKTHSIQATELLDEQN